MRTRILIAGGWGLVGSRIGKVLREAEHDVDLVLGGRNPDTGKVLAANLGLAGRDPVTVFAEVRARKDSF